MARHDTVTPRPDISVVVCSLNGERRLPRLLASLERQSLPKERFEVVVVDSGSTDRTAQVAERWGVRVERMPRGTGLPASRNAGVSAARAPLIAFTDDDCEADPRWVEGLLVALADPDVAGAGGAVRAGPGGNLLLRYLAARNPIQPRSAELLRSSHPLYRLALYLRATTAGPRPLRAGERLYMAVGANMGMRRTVVYQVGGFDEGDVGSEEEDLWRRARAANPGLKLVYEPRAVIVHHFASDLRSTLRRARHYGHGHARLAAKHEDVRLIVYPAPVIVAALTLLGAAWRRRRLVGLAAVAPLLAYPRWVRDAASRRSAEPALYPFIDLLIESRHLVAQLEWRWRHEYRPVAPQALGSE